MNAASIKLLIIDDELPIRTLLRLGLGTQGMTSSKPTTANWHWRSRPRTQH